MSKNKAGDYEQKIILINYLFKSGFPILLYYNEIKQKFIHYSMMTSAKSKIIAQRFNAIGSNVRVGLTLDRLPNLHELHRRVRQMAKKENQKRTCGIYSSENLELKTLGDERK